MPYDPSLEHFGFSDIGDQFPLEAQPVWMRCLNELDLFAVAITLRCPVENAVRPERGLRCSCPACQPRAASQSCTDGRGRKALPSVQVFGRDAGQDRWLCRACQRGGDVLDFVAFKTGESRYFLLNNQGKAEVRALAVELILLLEGVYVNEQGDPVLPLVAPEICMERFL